MSIEILKQILVEQSEDLYIALSGGIDSLTLMKVAADVRTIPTIAVHAVSAAVPAQASLRCRELADKYNWQLTEINAGEFGDERYLSNPVNRCYYCKSNLFDTIKTQLGSNRCIATGTNTDDLGDYRPGLVAASERDVWQPYVESGIDKSAIRAIALQVGLGDLSELPSQPCLSSRVETGIRINVDDLGFVHKMETALSEHLGSRSMQRHGDIRCRIVQDGVVVQLPAQNEVFSQIEARSTTEKLINNICTEHGRVFTKIEPYKMGSAFLRSTEEINA